MAINRFVSAIVILLIISFIVNAQPPPPPPPPPAMGADTGVVEPEVNESEENISETEVIEEPNGEEKKSDIEQPTPTTEKSSRTIRILIFSNIITFILLVAALCFIFKQRITKEGIGVSEKSPELKQLASYIKNAFDKGQTYTSVKEELLNSGWKEKDIDEAFGMV